MMQKTIPTPRSIRAMIYMPTDLCQLQTTETWQEGLTVLRKPLEDGSNTHDERTNHDRPSSTIFLVEPWSNGHDKDGAQLVARRDKTQKALLNGRFVVLHISISEVWLVSNCGVEIDHGHSHLLNGPENCSVLMSWESNPEVISTPMQHRNNQTYISRRFGFLYHGTWSSSTRRVTMGSADAPVLTILSAVSIFSRKRRA